MTGVIVLGLGLQALKVRTLIERRHDKVVAFVIDTGDWYPGARFCGLPVYDTRYPKNWPDGFKFPCVTWGLSLLAQKMEALGYAVEDVRYLDETA